MDPNSTSATPSPPQNDHIEQNADASVAGSRKKVIEPINDLAVEKQKLMKLVEEESARETQQTPGAGVVPNTTVVNTAPVATPSISNPAQTQADEQAVQEMLKATAAQITSEEPLPAVKPQTRAQSDTLQQQKAQIQAEIQDMVNRGVIDQEVTNPTDVKMSPSPEPIMPPTQSVAAVPTETVPPPSSPTALSPQEHTTASQPEPKTSPEEARSYEDDIAL